MKSIDWLGIENQNTSGTYDFSHIEKEHQAEEEVQPTKAGNKVKIIDWLVEEEEAVGAEEEVPEEEKKH